MDCFEVWFILVASQYYFHYMIIKTQRIQNNNIIKISIDPELLPDSVVFHRLLVVFTLFQITLGFRTCVFPALNTSDTSVKMSDTIQSHSSNNSRGDSLRQICPECPLGFFCCSGAVWSLLSSCHPQCYAAADDVRTT